MTTNTPLGRIVRRYQVVHTATGVVEAVYDTYNDAHDALWLFSGYHIVILTQPVAGASFLTEGSAL